MLLIGTNKAKKLVYPRPAHPSSTSQTKEVNSVKKLLMMRYIQLKDIKNFFAQGGLSGFVNLFSKFTNGNVQKHYNASELEIPCMEAAHNICELVHKCLENRCQIQINKSHFSLFVYKSKRIIE